MSNEFYDMKDKYSLWFLFHMQEDGWEVLIDDECLSSFFQREDNIKPSRFRIITMVLRDEEPSEVSFEVIV